MSLRDAKTGLKVANGPYDPPSVRTLYGDATTRLGKEEIEALCREVDALGETEEELQDQISALLQVRDDLSVYFQVKYVHRL